MSDQHDIATRLVRIAGTLAEETGGSRILAFVDALPDDVEVEGRVLLVSRTAEPEARLERLRAQPDAVVLRMPDVDLDRSGQINLATLLALSQGVIALGDRLVCLVGQRGRSVDTLHVLTVGDRLDLLGTLDHGSDEKHVSAAVFQRVLTLALTLANEGREGRPVGALFVIGDTARVGGLSEQLVINPFRGYAEEERNILDASLFETVKEFSTIDGAFVIRGDGVIESAGTLLRASPGEKTPLPSGLGTRHAAAAGITHVTEAVAITVSESDGTVRIWRKGRVLSALEHSVA